ncbi:hypothetical protein TL16_g09651 [Triparma laevis f. inornata]|uniref:Uncharacterized protein n=1 Tax=Triparma laevis f. inornata TaxID=1714386 RepID=A0A9W7B3H4_9STRA|nr:hypothetical protein TL16_g09651 [Triparma laevis f. inornata]
MTPPATLTSPPTIFCDMDGCLCDFTKLAMQITQTPTPIPPKKLWSSIATYRKIHDGFYTDLEWLGGGEILLKGLEQYYPNLAILTGCPNGGWGGSEKYSWLASKAVASDEFKFDGIQWDDHANSRPGPSDAADDCSSALRLITCKSKLKQEFCRPGDVLIDDREDIGRRWEEAGGLFIHYKGGQYEARSSSHKLMNIRDVQL